MRITFSQGIKDIELVIEALPNEVVSEEELIKISENPNSEVRRAYDAALMLFEKYPEFKQLTLSTFTDKELHILEQAKLTKAILC